MYDNFDILYNNLSLITNEHKIFKVLYAEDDDILREQVLSILNEIFGKDNVISAVDGAQALKKYNQERPNMLILDIQMPKLNGLQVVDEIRNMEETNDISIAMFTAFSDFKYLSKALELNVDGYILKPLNQEQFLNLLLKMSKNLLNIVLRNKYQSILEKTNLEISNKNIELENKIIELEKEKRYSCAKNAIISNETLTKQTVINNFDPSWFRPSAREVKEPLKFTALFLLDDKYEEIKEIVQELDSIVPTVCKDKIFAINAYANLLKKISSILSTLYNELIVNIVKIINELIDNMLKNRNILESKKDKSLMSYLESLPRDLTDWLNIITDYGIYSQQEIFQSDMLVMALRQVSTFTQEEDEFDLDDFFF